MEPGRNQIIRILNGERTQHDITDKYVYQRGELFLAGKKGTDGSISGNIKKVASGVFVHSVFQPFPDQPPIVLSGHFPPIDKLLVL